MVICVKFEEAVHFGPQTLKLPNQAIRGKPNDGEYSSDPERSRAVADGDPSKAAVLDSLTTIRAALSRPYSEVCVSPRCIRSRMEINWN